VARYVQQPELQLQLPAAVELMRIALVLGMVSGGQMV
jgi:hypothetical protein